VQGRKVNLTLTTSGRLVTLSELDETVSQLDGVEEYQLMQTQPGVYRLQVVTRRRDRTELSAEAVAMLKKLYGPAAQVEVVFQTALGPEESGKYLIARSLFPLDLAPYLE